LTRLLVLAAALVCAAAAPVASQPKEVVDAASAVERHWLAYHALQPARAIPAACQPQ
jgi:hypothetical protein